MTTAKKDPITDLARDMNVKYPDHLDPLTPAARRALDRVLKDLDAEERETLVLLNAVGPWDWHMVDGTGRIWHFTASGRMSWNMLSDRNETLVWERADNVRGYSI